MTDKMWDIIALLVLNIVLTAYFGVTSEHVVYTEAIHADYDPMYMQVQDELDECLRENNSGIVN